MIDLDAQCRKCGKKGAEKRTGLCLNCIADEAEKVPVTPLVSAGDLEQLLALKRDEAT